MAIKTARVDGLLLLGFHVSYHVILGLLCSYSPHELTYPLSAKLSSERTLMPRNLKRWESSMTSIHIARDRMTRSVVLWALCSFGDPLAKPIKLLLNLFILPNQFLRELRKGILIGSALGYMSVPYHSNARLHTESFGITMSPTDWLLRSYPWRCLCTRLSPPQWWGERPGRDLSRRVA